MRMIIVVSLALLLLGVGCSDKEGALLRITSELDRPIVSLRFYTGEDIVKQEGYYADSLNLPLEGVEGRDLSAEPFLLFLNSKNVGGEEQRLHSEDIVVGVKALNADGDTIGYGYSDTIRFGAGQIREWPLVIKRLDDSYVEIENCMVWNVGGAPVHVGTPNDQDCDGDLAGEGEEDDCDDHNPDRFHGQVEVCGNDLDDNCNNVDDEDEDHDDDGFLLCANSEALRDCDDNDNQTFPRSAKVCGEDTYICSNMESPPSRVGTECFPEISGDGCFGGLWTCDGSDNGELVCDTMDGAYPVRSGYCTPDPDCDQSNLADCIPTEEVDCSFFYTTNMPIQVCGSGGVLGAGSFSFPIPAGPSGCVKSKVVDDTVIEGWSLRVKDGPGDCIGDVVEATRIMMLPNPQSGPVSVVIEQSDETDVLYRFDIAVEGSPVGECEATDGFFCMSNGSDWDLDMPAPTPNN